jgi:hypothetical protein
MEKDNGGNVFPVITDIVTFTSDSPGYDIKSSNGMSLRDYFAAQAIQGILSNSTVSAQPLGWERMAMCETAYQIADEMLEAKDK